MCDVSKVQCLYFSDFHIKYSKIEKYLRDNYFSGHWTLFSLVHDGTKFSTKSRWYLNDHLVWLKCLKSVQINCHRKFQSSNTINGKVDNIITTHCHTITIQTILLNNNKKLGLIVCFDWNSIEKKYFYILKIEDRRTYKDWRACISSDNFSSFSSNCDTAWIFCCIFVWIWSSLFKMVSVIY